MICLRGWLCPACGVLDYAGRRLITDRHSLPPQANVAAGLRPLTEAPQIFTLIYLREKPPAPVPQSETRPLPPTAHLNRAFPRRNT